ncbi:TetR/AcrR family transcriptional regulator [Porticoccus sp.]
MGRQPEFERAQVLDSALGLFWSDGYEVTSISKLLDVMDLNRGSLYSSFGGKKALFAEVLDHYMAMFRAQLYHPTLESIADPKQAISSFFQKAFIEPEDKGRLANGCLFLNAISELNKTEPALADKAIDSIRWLRELLLARLLEAQQAGQVSPDKDPASLADFLIALTSGLRAQCKSGSDEQTLQRVIDTGLSSVFSE